MYYYIEQMAYDEHKVMHATVVRTEGMWWWKKKERANFRYVDGQWLSIPGNANASLISWRVHTIIEEYTYNLALELSARKSYIDKTTEREQIVWVSTPKLPQTLPQAKLLK